MVCVNPVRLGAVILLFMYTDSNFVVIKVEGSTESIVKTRVVLI